MGRFGFPLSVRALLSFLRPPKLGNHAAYQERTLECDLEAVFPADTSGLVSTAAGCAALPSLWRRAPYLQSHESRNPNGLPLARVEAVCLSFLGDKQIGRV